jgi:uncharacterized protein YdiU (UPF0061 family)
MMGYKLGLPSLQGEDDDQLLAELLSVLQSTETDMTIFFRRLDRVAVATADVAEDSALVQVFADAFYNPDEALSAPHAGRLAAWLRRWSQRVARDGAPEAERLQRLRAANPVYIPRNYMAQLAIDAAEQGDCGPLLELLRVVQEPYTEQEGMAKWAEKRPDWARHRAGCSALSCSS